MKFLYWFLCLFGASAIYTLYTQYSYTVINPDAIASPIYYGFTTGIAVTILYGAAIWIARALCKAYDEKHPKVVDTTIKGDTYTFHLIEKSSEQFESDLTGLIKFSRFREYYPVCYYTFGYCIGALTYRLSISANADDRAYDVFDQLLPSFENYLHDYFDQKSMMPMKIQSIVTEAMEKAKDRHDFVVQALTAGGGEVVEKITASLMKDMELSYSDVSNETQIAIRNIVQPLLTIPVKH